MASITNRLMTFAEFQRMPESGHRYELRHGELVAVPPPAHKHVLIQIRLRRLLESAAHGMGEINTEQGFRALSEHEYRVADVAFIARERWARIPPDGYLEGAPDLVIEVLSPSNSAAEVAEKQQLCLDNGAKEFWAIDPRRAQVKVSTTDGGTITYQCGQEIPLLFGGAVAVDEIFQD